MKRSQFSDMQVIAILKYQDSSVSTAYVCLQHRISSVLLDKRKSKFGGLEVAKSHFRFSFDGFCI